MDDLARKLINDHRNPIVKVDVPCSKLFLKSCTQEEIQFIEKHQTNLENILSYERAERRCARSQATWSPEDKLAKVTKAIKTLNHFGYGDKNGMYLYPEETLFLMETNRLEVMYDGVPLSIQDGYNLFLKSSECDLLKYKVYKKLALLGYKLLRYSELLRKLSKMGKEHKLCTNNDVRNDECCRKRISDVTTDSRSKKRKLNSESMQESSVTGGSGSSITQSQLEYVNKVFENLRKTAPREYEANVVSDEAPNYCVFLPNNKTRCNYDFNLFIWQEFLQDYKYQEHEQN